jgi:hypothetical protein
MASTRTRKRNTRRLRFARGFAYGWAEAAEATGCGESDRNGHHPSRPLLEYTPPMLQVRRTAGVLQAGRRKESNSDRSHRELLRG